MLLPGAHQSLIPRSTAHHVPRTAVDTTIEALAAVGIAIRLLLPLFAWGALPVVMSGHAVFVGRTSPDAGGWVTLLVPATALLLGALGLLVARWPRGARPPAAARVSRQGGRVVRLLALECAWLLALCEWVAVTDPTGALRLGLTIAVLVLVTLIALTPAGWVTGLTRPRS